MRFWRSWAKSWAFAREAHSVRTVVQQLGHGDPHCGPTNPGWPGPGLPDRCRRSGGIPGGWTPAPATRCTRPAAPSARWSTASGERTGAGPGREGRCPAGLCRSPSGDRRPHAAAEHGFLCSTATRAAPIGLSRPAIRWGFTAPPRPPWRKRWSSCWAWLPAVRAVAMA